MLNTESKLLVSNVKLWQVFWVEYCNSDWSSNLISSSSSYSYLRSRDLLVLQVPLDHFLGGGLPAVLPFFRWSSGCSFPYWFPLKCDAWQSSLFHSSHVSVPISFSLSPPSYDILHPTLFLNVSVPHVRSILFFFPL